MKNKRKIFISVISFFVIVALIFAGFKVSQSFLSGEENNSGSITSSTVVPINKPKGWSSKSDKTKNSSKYEWPEISPTSVEAGVPIVEKIESNSTDVMKQFVLMQELNTSLPFSVECNISENEITALLPAGTQINALIPEFSFEGEKITVKGKNVESGKTAFNFTEPIEFTIHNNGKKEKYTVYIMTLDTGLPSMSINTEDFDDISSKTEYKKCSVFAGGGDTNNGDYSFAKNEYISASGKIKGRGWGSWYYYPKKSYTLKLEEKQSFLGLPSHKEWVLVANFADRTLMRNAVAMELSRCVGAETVMDVRFVDLWVNGVYVGNYQLIEKIEISEERVDITKFSEDLSPEEVGFIVETNGHNKAEGEFGTWTNGMDADRPTKWQKLSDKITYDPISGDIFFDSLHYPGIIFNVKKPSDSKLMELSESRQLEYLEYIYNYLDDMEAAIKSRDYSKASEYVDMEAMAKWYIVEELSMNTDSTLHCSCYMYKDAGGKMKMGPVWDFDLGLGNGKYANEGNVNSTYLDRARWFADLLAMPDFKEVVKSVWEKSESQVNQLPSFTLKTAKMIDKSQKYNFELWSINQYAEHAYYITTEDFESYGEQIDYLDTFVKNRINYMDEKISNW